MKTYLHKLIKILQFFSRGGNQKFLSSLRNILTFSITSHLQAVLRIWQEIFLHVIPVHIIVP